MSVTVNCFEGIKIEKCSCPAMWCCRRNSVRNSVNAPAAVTNGVVYFGAKDDEPSEIEPYYVCVIQSPNRTLTTIGPDSDDDDLSDWDTMLVDVKHRIVSLEGRRWPHLMHTVPKGPKGQDLSVLRSVMRTVCEPLVTLALTGISKQMHTICNGQNMTMFASPLHYDKQIIGVQLTYRPTSYTQDDVLRIITHCDDI